MKKKLSLSLDALRVESFETTDGLSAGGTVRAFVDTDCCTASCTGTCGAQLMSDRAAAIQSEYSKCLNCDRTRGFECCV